MGSEGSRLEDPCLRHGRCMDYDEPANKIEELEFGEKEAVIMLGRELMRFKKQTPTWKELLDPPALKAYAGLLGSKHPTVEDMEEFAKRLND